MNSNQAWQKQSASLVEVQKFGNNLEETVRNLLGWKSGKITYDIKHGYQIQVDAAWPSLESPEAIASITYTNPDKPGHSNENKFHLKVGELALLKHAFPEMKAILLIGGTREAWLSYVLEAFKYFFDETIYLWDGDSALNRIQAIKDNIENINKKNDQLWKDLSSEWDKVEMNGIDDPIPNGLLRYEIADLLQNENQNIDDPSLIRNEISRICMQRSCNCSGKEWEHFKSARWHQIEMSRNYFNPVEATVELSLSKGNFEFLGGIGRDVRVPSLLNKLGMSKTKVSEDFVLQSKRLKCPVFIQCKSSGGGREQHGKNIQNRTKEQITRSLLYRCEVKSGKIVLAPKQFHWISILDGNWGVTTDQPNKYIHMLQWAGYDKIIGSKELVTQNYEVKDRNNPLINYLTSLDCKIRTS